MKSLCDYKFGAAHDQLDRLLRDRTTGEYIRFNTDNYQEYGYGPEDQMTPDVVLQLDILPRVAKSKEQQKARSKAKAEVFTPSWICNTMNNVCDTEWFGHDDVFNIEDKDHHTWTPTDKVIFPSDKTWEEYVNLNKIEITCGEAPFIVSRYDTTTGEIIPISHRIGFLDRKLRVIKENHRPGLSLQPGEYLGDGGFSEWYDWVKIAFQRSYGFEWSGDNLLLARVNMLNTYYDYAYERADFKGFQCISWKKFENTFDLIATIISWNIFQMDGLKFTLPNTDIPAKIMDWEKGEVIEFRSLAKKEPETKPKK